MARIASPSVSSQTLKESDFRKNVGKVRGEDPKRPFEIAEIDVWEYSKAKFRVHFIQPSELLDSKRVLIKPTFDDEVFPWVPIVCDAEAAYVYWQKMVKMGSLENRKKLALLGQRAVERIEIIPKKAAARIEEELELFEDEELSPRTRIMNRSRAMMIGQARKARARKLETETGEIPIDESEPIESSASVD